MSTVWILGKGVIGLGAALFFLRNGHEVHVVSDNRYFFPTSRSAAAFWYPYACSMTEEEERLLAEPTLNFLVECSRNPASGVQIRHGLELFDKTVGRRQRRPPWWAKLDGIQFAALSGNDIEPRFRQNQLIGPFPHAWSFRVPVVHMPKFLSYLEGLVLAEGGQFHEEHVDNLEGQLQRCSTLVNCAGGWSTLLFPDSLLVGYQGVLIELPGEPLGSDLIFIERGQSETLPTYIVPQGSRTMLGGTLRAKTTAGEPWKPGDKTLWTPDDNDTQSVWKRCKSLCAETPNVDAANLTAIAALRPRRQESPPRIQIERRDEGTIIHNYGHGGAGLTTFWGSAARAYGLFASDKGEKTRQTLITGEW